MKSLKSLSFIFLLICISLYVQSQTTNTVTGNPVILTSRTNDTTSVYLKTATKAINGIAWNSGNGKIAFRLPVDSMIVSNDSVFYQNIYGVRYFRFKINTGSTIDSNALTLQKAFDKSIALGETNPVINTGANRLYVNGPDANQVIASNNTTSGKNYYVTINGSNETAGLVAATNHFLLYGNRYHTGLPSGVNYVLTDTSGTGDLVMKPQSGGSGGGTNNPDSLANHPGSYYLNNGSAAGGDLSSTYPNPTVNWANGYSTYDARYLPNGLIQPGYVAWSGSGLTFNVTSAIYAIDGVRYTSNAGSITLSTADPSLPRYDVIAVDNTGTIVKITGTAASNPSIPQVDPATQVLLTTVFVDAGATTPTQITQQLLYDENTENYTGTASGVTVNFTNTSSVQHGSKSADVGSWTANNTITFTKNSGTDLSTNYLLLNGYINLKSAVANSANIRISFLNGTTVVSNVVTLNSSYGFTKTITGSYQTISIPLSAFTFTNTTFNKVKITLSGAGGGFYLDYFQLQAGINSGNTTTNWGSIAGTLSNQTDLQNALNAKEDVANKQTTLDNSATHYPSTSAIKPLQDTLTSHNTRILNEAIARDNADIKSGSVSGTTLTLVKGDASTIPITGLPSGGSSSNIDTTHFQTTGRVIFQQTNFTSGTGYTVVSGTPTYTNGYMRLSGSADSVKLNGYTNNDAYKDYIVKFRATSLGTFSLAAKSVNIWGFAFSNISVIAKLNTSTNTLSFYDGTNTLQLSATLPFTIATNDYIQLTYSQRGGKATISVQDVTQNTLPYPIPFTASQGIANSSDLELINNAGTNDIATVSIISHSFIAPYIAFVGDSKLLSVSSTIRWVDEVKMGTYAEFSGGSDGTPELLLDTNYFKIVFAGTKYVVLVDPRRNDSARGLSSATSQANYVALVNFFKRLGCTVIHGEPIPEGVSGGGFALSRKNWLDAFFAADLRWDPSPGFDTTLFLETLKIHPNETGSKFIANSFHNSGLIPIRTEIQEPASPLSSVWQTNNAFSTGLTNTYNSTTNTNTVTNNLSTGIVGGQLIIGGTGVGDNLRITSSSTTGSQKGKIFFDSSWYDGIQFGSVKPAKFHLNADATGLAGNYYDLAGVNKAIVGTSDANGIITGMSLGDLALRDANAIRLSADAGGSSQLIVTSALVNINPHLTVGTGSSVNLLDVGNGGVNSTNAIIGVNSGATGNAGMYYYQNGTVKAYSLISGSTDAIITGSVIGDRTERVISKSFLWSVDNGTTANMDLNSSGNLLIGGTSPPSSLAKGFALFNGTAATGNISGISLWSASGELNVRDASGNVTVLSPHNFDHVKRSNAMAWSYTSQNDSVGKWVQADMYKALKTIETQSAQIEELKADVQELKNLVTHSTTQYKKKKSVKLIYTGKLHK